MTAQTSPKKLQLSDELLDDIRKFADEVERDPEDLLFDLLERERARAGIERGRAAIERGDYVSADEFRKQLDADKVRLEELAAAKQSA